MSSRKQASANTSAPALPGMEALRIETGCEALPMGASELGAKELAFVLSLMRHGQQRRAAIEAGYSTTSADQIASELMRKPHVRRVLVGCYDRLGTTAVGAIRRLEERASTFHAKAMSAAQEREELAVKMDELVLVTASDTSHKGDRGDLLRQYETRRALLERQEKEYSRMAKDADDSLLRAAGKFGAEIKVSGKLDGGIGIITPETIAALTAMREATPRG